MQHFTHYRAHVGVRADKHHKATMFHGEHMLVGLNSLEPGQTQPLHDHATQDKVYIVMEGTGQFTVGEAIHTAQPGSVIFAPAGVPHGVINDGTERLVIVVNISPPPGK